MEYLFLAAFAAGVLMLLVLDNNRRRT